MRTRSREVSKQSAPLANPAKLCKTKPPKAHAQETVKEAQTDFKDLGLPSRKSYMQAEHEYIQSLSQRKREKALLSQPMFDDIWDVLHNPGNPGIRTPQFRFWVRKMFTLSLAHREQDGALFADNEDADVKPVILHENRPVAIKTQLYDILGYCHQVSHHGGRDRTVAKVRELYSWVPKELVAKYVKACPTCVLKRSGNMSLAMSLTSSGAPILDTAAVEVGSRGFSGEGYGTLEEMTPQRDAAKPARNFTAHAQLYHSSPNAALTSQTLPLLPPPSVLAPNDPGRWLADLVSQPGPGSAGDLHLAPLLRRTESETAAVPMRHPRTIITLPPLMKALSENMIDSVNPMHRPAFGVPDAFRIPPVQTTSASNHAEHYPMEIDPVLLFEDRQTVSTPQWKAAEQVRPSALDPSMSLVAATVGLPRKVLIPMNVMDVDMPNRRVSDSLSAASTRLLSHSSSLDNVASSVFSGRISASGSQAANISTASHSSAGQKSNRFLDPQDWESSYCLDQSM